MSEEKQISDNRSEIYNLLRGKSAEEFESIVTRLCEELAFHSSRGGVKLAPKMGWCVMKYLPSAKTLFKFHDNLDDALKDLNEHHQLFKLPPFDKIDKTLQKALCFESPTDFTVEGSLGGGNFEDWDAEAQRAEVAKQMSKNVRRNLKKIQTENATYKVSIKNHPDFESLRDAYLKSLYSRLEDYGVAVKNSIINPSSMSLKNDHGLKSIPHSKPANWVSIESDPGASFLNALRTILLDTNVASIAEVLAFSHPILEKGYVPEPDRGPRKPINDNNVHGVFTTSKVNEIIETMAMKGFDNQPIYCKDSGRCVGSIRLREAMKNLYMGRYSNHPTFQNYHDMIKENLMLLPPPMFSPTDSIEYVVSIFNSGCEAILFEFDKKTWLEYGGAPEVAEVLENGLHILTPHDVVIYFLEN